MTTHAPGLSAELSITVTDADIAAKWGSGLVGIMEAAAVSPPSAI